MSNYFFKCIAIILSLGMLIFPVFIKAEILYDDFDLNRLKGQKLGYYIGSFDPIHLGHQYVIEQALKSGYVDYILIYPAPGGDQFKNRTDLILRQKMIASVYQEHSRVLMTYWTPKELQDKFATFSKDIDIIGIIGSDVVTETLMGPDKELSEKYRSVFMRGLPLKEKHYKDTVGALMALTDCVNMNEGRPQIYGTQWVQKDGKYLLYSVDDIEHLNERRSEMGLNTIEEYKKQIQIVYQLKDEDFI